MSNRNRHLRNEPEKDAKNDLSADDLTKAPINFWSVGKNIIGYLPYLIGLGYALAVCRRAQYFYNQSQQPKVYWLVHSENRARIGALHRSHG